jgi:Ser/Thr protein kinase RdoA (MazF antagonist)
VPDNHADDEVARRALSQFDFSEHAQIRMINLSENATYLVEDTATQRDGVLRVHRENYHLAESIGSELLWLDALRAEWGIRTPAVIPARDGRRVVTLEHAGVDRHAVLFEMMGGMTARLHLHARSWRLPPGFTRFSWDWRHTLGSAPRWGRWQDGIGIGDPEVALLSRLSDQVEARLKEFGSGSDRFGLVHADLRLANLLVDGDHINVIDFDDCGFSWFLYDFGSAVSFMEDDPRLGEWQAAWVEGYRDFAELSPVEEEMLSTFVMLRRMMLVSWMGSHSHSRECQVKGPGYARGTCELAEKYLSSAGRSL